MGRPKMTEEEKAAAARKRARLRAMGKLPPLGSQKRGKRLTKGPRGARVKRGGRPAGSKNKVGAASRAQVSAPLSMDSTVTALLTGLTNLTIRVDQGHGILGQLQNALIQANSHIAKLYELVGKSVPGAMPMPTAVQEVSESALGGTPMPTDVPEKLAQVNGEAPKKKGRPALTEEEKAARAAAKATTINATPVVADPPKLEVVKPVVPPKAQPVVVTPKVISVPDEDAFEGAQAVNAPAQPTQSVGSSEDLGLE